MSHPVLERLKSPDPEERRAACADAARDPAATLLVDALAEALGDPVKAVWRAASDALAVIAREVGGVDRVLRDALHSDERGRRFAAALTLARLEAPGPRLLPALFEALSSPDGDVRWSAARVLVATGRVHGEVLPLLLGLARSERPGVRRMATFCLRELAPELPAAARALVEATRDPELAVRRAAMTAMAALLDPPRAVVERLTEALADPDPPIRRSAAVALGQIGAAHPGLLGDAELAPLRTLRDGGGDPQLRRAAQQALARLAECGGGARR